MESDAQEQINEQLEYKVEFVDGGIGAYEWHGSKEIDINLEIRLTDDVVLVEYTDDKDEMVYVRINGYYKDYDTDLDMEWVAQLEGITYKQNHYMAEYSITIV
tara:strand:+ start:856 stop:1164 length:309 start_codon:yes stop_codon:yes gene_type:complete